MLFILRITKRKIKFLLTSKLISLGHLNFFIYRYNNTELLLINFFLHIIFFSVYRFFISILKRQVNESFYIFKKLKVVLMNYIVLLYLFKKYFYNKCLFEEFLYLEFDSKQNKVIDFWSNVFRLMMYLNFLKIEYGKHSN